jgi:hypothetical protein
MCTVTFLPRGHAYLLAMNRDERLTREAALAPQENTVEGVVALYPREASGGTWIAANEFGVTLALLNRNSEDPGAACTSRGTLIPRLIALETAREVGESLAAADLNQVVAFRLIGVFPGEQCVAEWRWSGSGFRALTRPWRARHWFSCGISDTTATRERGRQCRRAWRASDAASIEWLRELHASHGQAAGAFSVCMHRADAATVSYTEVGWDSQELVIAYSAGPPCSGLKMNLRSITRQRQRGALSV